MRVIIERMEGAIAHFHSDCGRGIGRWEGDLPRVGEAYGVEISIDTPLILGVNLFRTQEPAGLRVQEGGLFEAVGEVVELYAGGPLSIRVSDTVIEADLHLPAGTPVVARVRGEDVTLWDTHI